MVNIFQKTFVVQINLKVNNILKIHISILQLIFRNVFFVWLIFIQTELIMSYKFITNLTSSFSIKFFCFYSISKRQLKISFEDEKIKIESNFQANVPELLLLPNKFCIHICIMMMTLT